jgi:hypothetical protein
VLRTCVLNSRVYHGVASIESPAFQVLPELAAAVTALLDAQGRQGGEWWLRFDVLIPAHTDSREDLSTLLALLVQHHVLEMRPVR